MAIFYVYLGYPMIISLLALFKPKRKVQDIPDAELPFVSLIIAAYNEELHIERKLKNCLGLDYPQDRLEIIIGSDASVDGTNAIVQKYVSERVRFFPHQIRRGKMAVVNDGVLQAKGTICVFTDVSELFDKDAIKKLVRNFRNQTIGAVTGNHIYNPSPSGIAKGVRLYWRYQRWMQQMESKVATIMSCDGTIYACRRNLYVPPPTGTINDDKAVPWKILETGRRIILEPAAVARGDSLSDTGSFFRQKVRGQAGMYQLFFMFRRLFLPTQPLLWFIFISHAVGPVMVPWFMVMLLISNCWLIGQPIYNFLFLLQTILYGSAVIGMIMQCYRIYIPFLNVPYIFTVSNIASIVGFWAFLFKTQKATWKKVE